MQVSNKKNSIFGVFSAFCSSFASKNPINMRLLYAVKHTFLVFLFIVLSSKSRSLPSTPYMFCFTQTQYIYTHTPIYNKAPPQKNEHHKHKAGCINMQPAK